MKRTRVRSLHLRGSDLEAQVTFEAWWRNGYPLVVANISFFAGLWIFLFVGFVHDKIPSESVQKRTKYIFTKKYMATFGSILCLVGWLGLTVIMLIWGRL